ncbi:MAG: transposon-encoded TnpW family protein, partial [Clostridia bacterium]|nr:transposon-encoded TnpW family protein [Clostridia bacterium]
MDCLDKEVMVKETPATAPESSGLIMKSGGTTFVIGLHFSETSKDTLDDKVKKL